MPAANEGDGGVLEENPEMVAVGDNMMVVKNSTPPNTQVTYRVTVKYTGDIGAKSGVIQMAYPLPDHMTYDSDVEIKRSEIKYTTGDTGFFGGRVVTEPYVDTSSGKPILRATFEGLYTGTEIEVDVTGISQSHDYNSDGYMFWDGTAYAQDGASSAVSKTVRLWYPEDLQTTPETPEYRVSYVFTGELPDGAELLLPQTEFHKQGDTVTSANKPTEPEGYTIDGWERTDHKQTGDEAGNKVTPGDTFEMPGNDVTLTGTWTNNDPKQVQVEYRYADGSPDVAPAIGTGQDALILSPQTHKVGEQHTIAMLTTDFGWYSFDGWDVSLELKNQTYQPTSTSNGVYTFTVNGGTTITLDTAGGVIQTSALSGVATATPEETKVILTGSWTPYTGTIKFDSNGGQGSMSDMENVTPNDTRNLTKNTFTLQGMTFRGWSLYPGGGGTLWEDEASAAGFITQKGQTVTLYAQWSKEQFDITYDLTHTTSTEDKKTAEYGDRYETILKPEDGYTMENVEITMGGVDITDQVYDPSTGKVTIPEVTGDLVIRAEATNDDGPYDIEYDLTHVTSTENKTTIDSGESYETLLEPEDGYTITDVEITMDGEDITDDVYNPETGEVKIPSVTGDVVIKAEATDNTEDDTFTIEVTVEGGTATPGGTHGTVSVVPGDDQSFTFTPNEGYTLKGVYVDGNTVSFNNGQLSYIFENVQADHSIRVVFEKTATPGGGGNSGGGGGGTPSYTLTYESNGGTKYEDESYPRGTVVELDKVPVREGYTFTGWYADEELTELITEIKMTGNKTVYAGWERTGVPDWLNGKDHFAYVIGYPDGTVQPLDNISRGEVATIFFRLLDPEVREANLTNVNTFDDVNEGVWFNTPVSTMAKLGIVKGRSPNSFDPEAPITRAEFAAICARFDTAQRKGDSNFTDIAGHWAEAEIERAATLGWIMGYADGSFRPENDITRAEAMTMINRVLQRLPETEDDLLPDMNVWPDNQPGEWYYLAVQEATNSHDFDRKDDGLHEHWAQMTEDPDWKQYE